MSGVFALQLQLSSQMPIETQFVDASTLLSQEGTTQGDPLAMPLYAIATLPLIHSLNADVKQVWYADDASACGKIQALRSWWDKLVSTGPAYGYNVNAPKTWLVVKESYLSTAKQVFQDTGVNVTTEGRPYLGAPLGTEEFTTKYVSEKVGQWCAEVDKLEVIAVTQPHAAYAAMTHRLTSKYMSRTVSNIGPLLHPLEERIRTKLIPALTGRPPPKGIERKRKLLA